MAFSLGFSVRHGDFLHAALVTSILLLLLTGSRRYTLIGLLTGLCLWVRPDGLTLAPLALLILTFAPPGSGERSRAILGYTLGLAALLLPYIVFNLWLAGTPFPNTFYAKQAEYAGWQSRSVFDRLGSGLLQVSTGPALLLWPAFGIQLAHTARSRKRRDARSICLESLVHGNVRPASSSVSTRTVPDSRHAHTAGYGRPGSGAFSREEMAWPATLGVLVGVERWNS